MLQWDPGTEKQLLKNKLIYKMRHYVDYFLKKRHDLILRLTRVKQCVKFHGQKAWITTTTRNRTLTVNQLVYVVELYFYIRNCNSAIV